jgi:hypothetical protein
LWPCLRRSFDVPLEHSQHARLHRPHNRDIEPIVDEAFKPSRADGQAGKGLTGLDEHQVRRWTSWHRWVTLTMLAAAVLTIAAVLDHASNPGPPELIPLSRNAIAHLFSAMTGPRRDTSHEMRWSRWRRRHQHRARTCHYQRQIA